MLMDESERQEFQLSESLLNWMFLRSLSQQTLEELKNSQILLQEQIDRAEKDREIFLQEQIDSAIAELTEIKQRKENDRRINLIGRVILEEYNSLDPESTELEALKFFNLRTLMRRVLDPKLKNSADRDLFGLTNGINFDETEVTEADSAEVVDIEADASQQLDHQLEVIILNDESPVLVEPLDNPEPPALEGVGVEVEADASQQLIAAKTMPQSVAVVTLNDESPVLIEPPALEDVGVEVKRTLLSEDKALSLVDQAIDLIMAWNDEPERAHERKWFICGALLKTLLMSHGHPAHKPRLRMALSRRSESIDKHHKCHKLHRLHRTKNTLKTERISEDISM